MLAQTNLVPNPSFENIDTCFFSGGAIYAGIAPPWDSPNYNSPDLFNICDPYSLPNTFRGYKYPHSSHGMAGVFCFSGGNEREYMQVKLDSVCGHCRCFFTCN